VLSATSFATAYMCFYVKRHLDYRPHAVPSYATLAKDIAVGGASTSPVKGAASQSPAKRMGSPMKGITTKGSGVNPIPVKRTSSSDTDDRYVHGLVACLFYHAEMMCRDEDDEDDEEMDRSEREEAEREREVEDELLAMV
jgi:hypothetical protein